MKSVKTARMKNFTSAFLLQEIVNEARTLRRNRGRSQIHAGQSEREDTMGLWGRLDNLIYVLLKLRGSTPKPESEGTLAKDEKEKGYLADGPNRYLRLFPEPQALLRQKLIQWNSKRI
jgi:hypothetical protein